LSQDETIDEIAEKTNTAIKFTRSMDFRTKVSHFGVLNTGMITTIGLMKSGGQKVSFYLIVLVVVSIGLTVVDEQFVNGAHPDAVVEPGQSDLLSVRMNENPTLLYSTTDDINLSSIIIFSEDRQESVEVISCEKSLCPEGDGYQHVKDRDGFVLVGTLATNPTDLITIANNHNSTIIVSQGYQSSILHDSTLGNFVYETGNRVALLFLIALISLVPTHFLSKKFISRLSRYVGETACTSCNQKGTIGRGICRNCNGIGVLFSLRNK